MAVDFEVTLVISSDRIIPETQQSYAAFMQLSHLGYPTSGASSEVQPKYLSS